MKLLWSVLIALLGLSWTVRAQTPADYSLASNTLVAVLGPAGIKGLPFWKPSTAYTAGQLVQSTNYGQNYMCLVAGTSTNSATLSPTGLGRITDGTVTWVSMLSKPREYLLVQNTSTDITAKVYAGEYVGQNTNLTRTAVLYSGGHMLFSYPDDIVPQNKIFVWADKNATVSTWER